MSTITHLPRTAAAHSNAGAAARLAQFLAYAGKWLAQPAPPDQPG